MEIRTKLILARLIDWYKEASNWERVQEMNAARKRLDEPQRPNVYTRKCAEAERRARDAQD